MGVSYSLPPNLTTAETTGLSVRATLAACFGAPGVSRPPTSWATCSGAESPTPKSPLILPDDPGTLAGSIGSGSCDGDRSPRDCPATPYPALARLARL